MSAFDAFLAARGLKTLQLRIKAQSESAFRIACFLNEHPSVTRVWYPGLLHHRGHEIAKKQMSGGFGGILSFEVQGNPQNATKVVESTRLFHTAVSVGAVESIIEQPAFMSHASYDRKDRVAHGLSDGLIRISVGLEDTEDLIRDLYQALSQAGKTKPSTPEPVKKLPLSPPSSLPKAVAFG